MAASLIAATLVLGGCAAVVDRRATAREALAEAAYPPTGTFVTVDGVRVHAHIDGVGPDVVLIHGASGNTRDFTFGLVDRLKSDFRVIAFDRPGLGWSDSAGDRGVDPLVQADILRAAAGQLGVRDPVVLGHSYGGAVALAWALREPDGPRALVLLGGAAMPWPGGLGTWYGVTASRLGGATVVPLVAAFAPPAQAEGVVASIFAPDPVPPGYTAHVGAGLTLRRDTLRANARQVNGLKPHIARMAENYGALTLPVEIVHGTADTIVPARIHAIPLSERLPQARLTLIDGAGHMPHHSHPEVVVDAIRRAAGR